MFNHFAKNRGPAFMSDSVGGASTAAQGGGFADQLKGAEKDAEADNFKNTMEAIGMKKEQTKQALFGDAALKAVHQIQF